jgi:hypothetical protein
MSRNPPVTALLLLVIALCIATAGCSTTAPATEPAVNGNGTIHASSEPAGAAIWLDGKYWGLAPGAISGIPAGHHTVEFRMDGYDSVSYPVTVVSGGMEGISATLSATQGALPVTFAATTVPSEEHPQLHVDGYWLYPQVRSSTANPVLLSVHTEAFNTGYADAREVTVSANFYYQGRLACWNSVYLGTLAAGGHVSRDNLFSCTLPSPLTDADLAVRFENLTVNP